MSTEVKERRPARGSQIKSDEQLCNDVVVYAENKWGADDPLELVRRYRDAMKSRAKLIACRRQIRSLQGCVLRRNAEIRNLRDQAEPVFKVVGPGGIILPDMP